MDQQFVAGIGNLYSDEILFAAGLRYDRSSDSLSATEIRRLYRAMVETLAEAIKHRGSTLADEQYRDLFGEIGDYQGCTRSTTARASRAAAAGTRSSGSSSAAAPRSSASTARSEPEVARAHAVARPV